MLAILIMPLTGKADTKTIVIGSCIAAPLAYGIYKVGNWCVQRIIDREILDAINVLSISPLGDYSDSLLRKKAKLITMRQRIVVQLEASLSRLDGTHKDNVAAFVNTAKILFDGIDKLRSWVLPKNPYEQQYVNPSWIGSFVEKRIVNNIILSCKPDEDCTDAEKKAKKQIQQQRTKILQLLKQTSAYNNVLSYLLLA